MAARKVALGLATVGSALALAACGSNGGNAGSATATGGSSSSPGSDAHGAKSSAQIASLLSQALTKAQTANSFKLHGTATTDGVTITEQGEESVNPLNADLTVSGGMLSMAGTGSIEMRIVGGTIYMKMGSMAAGGKPWVKLDLANLGPQGQALAGMVRNANPVDDVRILVNSGDLTDEGSDNVEGVTAEHYHGTVQLSTLLNAQTSNLSPAEKAQISQLVQQSGVSSEVIDVWVDQQGRPVRIKEQVQTSTGLTEADRYLTDWGTPVSVTPPPADQVGTLPVG